MAEPSRDLITLPIPIARGGINKDIEPTSLENVFTPYMLNMILEARRVRKRLGYRQLGSNLPLIGIGSQLISYTDARGTTHDLAITTRHAYEYQGSTDMWLQITPGIDLDDCETGWTGIVLSPVAHYKLDDDAANTTVVDATGGSNGTLAGGDDTEDINITGQIDGGLDTNGSDDHIDANATFQATLRASFSFTLLVKPDDGQPAADQIFIGVLDQTGDDSQAYIMLDTDGKVRFNYESEGNAGNIAITSDVIFENGPASTWTHITCVAYSTVNGVGGKKIYINGIEATLGTNGSTAGVTFSQFTSAQNLYIGAYNLNGSASVRFAGGLDDVQLFDQALAAGAVKAIYDAAAAGVSGATSHDTSTKIRGASSLKIGVIDAASDGDQLAYKDISSTDITAHTHIGFWIKSSIDLAASALEIVISESNHAAGEKTGTFVEVLATALTADTWKFVSLAKTLTDYNAVISCSIYANATIAAGTVIHLDDIRGYSEFSGDVNKRVNSTISHDLNEFSNNGFSALILSNGVDDLFYLEGQSGDYFQTLVHGYGSFANTVEIEDFWNHLMFINFSTGSANVRSVAWADVGNVDDFSTGTSGLSYLTDSRGVLMRALKLGSDLVLFSARSITTCRYHGGTIIFLFPTLIYRTGLYSHSSLIGLTTGDLFLGTDQRIYAYQGGVQLQPIGKSIESSLFSELDSSKKNHIVSGYDEQNDQAIFAFPRSSDTYAQASYALNRKQPENPWQYFEYADSIRAFSMQENTFAWYFDDAQFVGIYADEVSFYADSAFTSTGYPTMITLSDDGYVYRHDEALGKDDAANIECEYQTQDITVDKEEHLARWEWLTFIAISTLASGTVSVFYSADEGVTWTEFNESPFTLTTAWQVFRKPFDKVSRKIRFRFYQNSASDLQLRDNMHVSFVLQTPRS